MHSQIHHNLDGIPLEVVPTIVIFAKDPSMRNERKRLDLTTDLKDGRRERVKARVIEAEEEKDAGTPCPLTGGKDICSSEEEANCIRLLFCSKKGKGTLLQITSIFLFYFLVLLNMSVRRALSC